MKAIRLQAYGDVDQFKLEEIAVPSAGEGEIVMQVATIGLNPVDIAVREGALQDFLPLSLPATLGIDAAGTIISVGTHVTGFAVSDRVMAFLPLNGNGAYAEFAAVPVTALAKIADSVSFEAAATLPLAGLTARQSIDALGIAAGDRVLVSGALGAVGRAAIQYLRQLGAIPVAGVRASRMSEGRQLAGEVIDIEGIPASPSFRFAVSTAEAVADNVLRFVSDGGMVASTVETSEVSNPNGRVTVIPVFAMANVDMLGEIADAAARGELTIPIAHTYALDQAAEAHRALATHPPGKIVLLNV